MRCVFAGPLARCILRTVRNQRDEREENRQKWGVGGNATDATGDDKVKE